MEKKWIPVAAPVLSGNEKKYVQDCLDSGWISSQGKYIQAFESEFAKFCQVNHAIACSNGTVALHLALMALGVGPQDEVIIPTLTYVATANAVAYCGAKPVFVDSQADTWNIDPELIESKINDKTKAIIVVHLYGNPCDLDKIQAIADKYNLPIIEDAAEAHGALFQGKKIGSIGKVNTFSFYGNKIITTGEGGMVTTNDTELAAKIHQLKGQGVDPSRRYYFPIIGYNYRMTNICAAIGLAQLENIDWHLEKRQAIANWYQNKLKTHPDLKQQIARTDVHHVHWMFNVLISQGSFESRDELIRMMAEKGVETRPLFIPVHSLPPYQHLQDDHDFVQANKMGASGITLPTWSGLDQADLEYVFSSFLVSLEKLNLIMSVTTNNLAG